MEGIPYYINVLEDSQNQSKWAVNTITSSTLLLIATNDMLSTECFPQDDEIWEDFSGHSIPSYLTPSSSSRPTTCSLLIVLPGLSKSGRTSTRTRRIGPPGNLYKAAHQKSKFKNQAIGGQDQSGTAHGALKQAPHPVRQANGPPRSYEDLNEYFDALAESATVEKGVLEELVKSNSALTIANAELSAAMAVLIKANEKLSCWVGNFCNNRTRGDSPDSRSKTMCPHCKP